MYAKGIFVAVKRMGGVVSTSDFVQVVKFITALDAAQSKTTASTDVIQSLPARAVARRVTVMLVSPLCVRNVSFIVTAANCHSADSSAWNAVTRFGTTRIEPRVQLDTFGF